MTCRKTTNNVAGRTGSVMWLSRGVCSHSSSRPLPAAPATTPQTSTDDTSLCTCSHGNQ